VTALITRYGALGVLLLMIPESACVPLPSEVTLLFSGFAVHAGWMSFSLAVLAATGGNLIGSLLAYALGASRLLERVPLARSALSGSQALLDRHGTRAVLIARMLPLARTFVSLPAGARRVPLLPFIALTALGCALWAAGFVSAGVLLGASWVSVSAALGRALLAVGLLVLALAVVARRRSRRSLS